MTSQAQSSSRQPARLRQQVLDDYRANQLTVQQIARKHKIAIGRVVQWAREAKLSRQRGRPPIPRSQISAALNDLKRTSATVQEIAERHGISARTLRTHAKNAGIPTTRDQQHQRNYQKLKPRVLHDYQHTQLTVNEIAERHGISSSTVGNWAAQAGLTRSTRSSNNPRHPRHAVLEDYRHSSLTLREISQKHGVSETSIRNWAKQEKAERLQPVPPPRSRAKAAVLADYQNLELTIDEVAEKHGVSTSSVHKWAREAGLDRRSIVREREEQLKPLILHRYTTSIDSLERIAKRFNTSKSVVSRFVREEGLTQNDRPQPLMNSRTGSAGSH